MTNEIKASNDDLARAAEELLVAVTEYLFPDGINIAKHEAVLRGCLSQAVDRLRLDGAVKLLCLTATEKLVEAANLPALDSNDVAQQLDNGAMLAFAVEKLERVLRSRDNSGSEAAR